MLYTVYPSKFCFIICLIYSSFYQVPHSWPPSACVHQQGAITRVETAGKSSEREKKKSLVERESQQTLTSRSSSTFSVSTTGKRSVLALGGSGEIEQYVLGREFGIQYTLLVYSATRPAEPPTEAATVAFRIRKLLCQEPSSSSGSCSDTYAFDESAAYAFANSGASGSSSTDALLRQQLLDALGIITPTRAPRASLQPLSLRSDPRSQTPVLANASSKADLHRPSRPVNLADPAVPSQLQPQSRLVAGLTVGDPLSNSEHLLHSRRGSSSASGADALPCAYLVQCFGPGNELRVRAQLDKKVRADCRCALASSAS